MAGDWIKVEKATPDKPEIGQLSRRLKMSREEAFARWFYVWRWLDDTVENGWVELLHPDDVDRVAGKKGFGLALEDVGWLGFDRENGVIEHDENGNKIKRPLTGSCLIKNWDRHNGQSAKKRAVTTRRKQAQRAKESKAPTCPPPPSRNERDICHADSVTEA